MVLVTNFIAGSVQANSDVKLGGAEACPKEGCPDHSPDIDGPSTNKQSNASPPVTANDVNEGKDGISDLAEVPTDPAWWHLLTQAKTELARVTGTLYDTLNTVTLRFAEIVRKIMNEELYDIIATLLTKVGSVMSKPGEL